MKAKILFSLSDDTLATVVFPSRLEDFTVTIHPFGVYEIRDENDFVVATCGKFVNLPGTLIKYFQDKGHEIVLA